MKRNVLGKTGIEVTELCFGALPMGPLQKNMNLEDCIEVAVAALELGINFVDTAQMYKTYAPIREAIKATGIRPVVATKSTATDYAGMEKAVYEALEQLGVDYIDIFLLHAARAGLAVFEERAEAIRCLGEFKDKGIVRAVGISTHDPRVARLTAEREDMDIVFPLINRTGIGVLNGTVSDMLEAIEINSDRGKGVYLMKILGGGNLINDYCASVDFARGIKGYHSITIGMVSREEVDFNVAYFNGRYDADKVPSVKGYAKRFQIFEFLCSGCKSCMEACPNDAIDYSETDRKARINEEKCLTCGYCTSRCPRFAIRAA